jgi:peptide deformylase
MVLPIYTYGEKVLSQKGEFITSDYPNLSELIQDMFETMDSANGIGLAAQQIGINIKLFIVDLVDYEKVDPELKQFKKVFINSEILETLDDDFISEEGCLSFPDIYFKIKRPSKIKLRYLDENFIQQEEWFSGLPARCILHEHDHTEGITFLKYMTPIKRNILQSKLKMLLIKNFNVSYKIKR